MTRTQPSRRIRGIALAAIGAALGLTALAAVWLARESDPGAPRAPAITAGTDHPGARSAGPRPGRAHPAPAAIPSPTAPEAEVRPDVRPPAPPEAFSPAPAGAAPADHDTGLVFHGEPPGDSAAEQVEKSSPPPPPGPASGPARSTAPADVRPPPPPEIMRPAAPRAGPDHDTGLIFSGPPRAGDAGADQP
jgi:hypothetical protein